ncbi:pyridoxamine 5'-phosphate oxidase family protein [Aneurinibacillus sp. REN35]|uniref:pyridoxamine 5'-phosphate oxidase family protein n=1 Tax=Aneurinibacillus sp. REN35 TaxID=3237286 RepID=UPI0035299857
MEMGFHSGERRAHKLAGVRMPDDFTAKMYRNHIPKAALGFLQKQNFVFVSSIDSSGRVWASIIQGEPGFIDVVEEKTIVISGIHNPEDPLVANIHENGHIGTLFMDFLDRRRLRVNGTASYDKKRLIIHTEQVYGNCPKYITTRRIETSKKKEPLAVSTLQNTSLLPSQAKWIEDSDTFFIASTNNQREVDASHRGGNPGFVKIIDDTHLLFPDYFGNNMFNTLGNIEVNPNVGLIFINFENCKTLQISGRANIRWNEGASDKFPGAERLLDVEIEKVIETRNALSFTSELLERSPFNPK